MKAPKPKRFVWPTPGTCRCCGCTDARACPGGCSWVDHDHIVCSTCGGTEDDLAGLLDWFPRMVRRLGAARDVAATIARYSRDAVNRYNKRLVEQDHG